ITCHRADRAVAGRRVGIGAHCPRPDRRSGGARGGSAGFPSEHRVGTLRGSRFRSELIARPSGRASPPNGLACAGPPAHARTEGGTTPSRADRLSAPLGPELTLEISMKIDPGLLFTVAVY